MGTTTSTLSKMDTHLQRKVFVKNQHKCMQVHETKYLDLFVTYREGF